MAQSTVGTAEWRASLVDASWRGVTFKVERDSQSGGRRNVTFEFPQRDIPYTQDLGRRARRWQITGYIIGRDYLAQQESLISALEQENYGTLQHPLLLGQVQANLDTYTTSVMQREFGGMCTFEMSFVEAGNLTGTIISINTAVQAVNSATSAINSVVSDLNSTLKGLTLS